VAWVREDDGQTYCGLHDHRFVAGIATCPGCDSDPLDSTTLDDAQPVDAVALADEAWCRTERDYLTKLAHELEEERDEHGLRSRMGFSTVAKVMDTALKYHRAAVEDRVRRGDIEHDRYLAAEVRRLKGVQ